MVSTDGKTVKPQKEVAEKPLFLVTSDAQGKTDVTIDISGYKLDPEKLYRFEFTLTPSGNSEKHYTAYIDLKICTVYPFSPATPRLFTFAYISYLFTATERWGSGLGHT